MKGKVLGFSAADGSGAISGEDGTRHKFSQSDWRGDRPPAVGMPVDFESEGGVAKDVYPVGGAAMGGLGNVDLSGISAALNASGAGGSFVDRLKSQLTTTLAFPLALIVLIAFFLPALSAVNESPNQFGLGDQAKAVRLQLMDTDIAARTADMDQTLEGIERDIATEKGGGFLGMGPSVTTIRHLEGRRAEIQQEKEALNKAGGSIGLLKFTTGVFMLRFGALAGALALLWMSWSAARATPLLSLATGGLALVTVALVFAFESGMTAAMRVGAIFNMLDEAQIDAALSIGIGTWLLALAGIALIASGLGLIRNPLTGR